MRNDTFWLLFWYMVVCLSVWIALTPTKAHSAQIKPIVEVFSNQQIANAIRKAEGTWTYGIKSVRCDTEEDCRAICINTIQKNRKRFTQYGYKRYPDFLSFLGSRYCPLYAGNDPKGLNRNWLHNVRYFLRKDNT